MNPSSHWSSVVLHIPSIDSDSSSSENEEDIAIFRRPIALLPEDTGSLECLSLEDTEIEEMLTSVAHPEMCWTEETFCNKKKLSIEPLGAHEATDLSQQATQGNSSPIGIEANGLRIHGAIRNSAQAGSHSFSSVPGERKGNTTEHQSNGTSNRQSTTDSTSLHPSRNAAFEDNTLKPVKIQRSNPNTSTEQLQQNGHTDEGSPVLSFTPLEHWDLDHVLQTLKKNGHQLRGNVSNEPVKLQQDGDNERSQGNIMERLTSFCKKQSCGDIKEKGRKGSVKTDSVPQKAPEQYPTECRNNCEWRNSFKRMAAGLQLSGQESPTVYIDLRNHEPPAKTTRSCNGISSISRTLNNPNPEEDNPSTLKTNCDMQTGSTHGRGEMTGKSMLLRKLRVVNRNGIDPDRKHPDPLDYMCGTLKKEGMRQKPHQHRVPEGDSGKRSLPPKVDNQTTASSVQCDQNRPQIKRILTIQQSATTGLPKHHSDQEQREKQKQQHKQRQQLQEQLESLRPTRSVRDKEPAAEKTDVLYDTEATYLQSINTLPAHIEDKECLLLTVCLSSPGLVASNSSGKAQTVESATTKSHVYNSLVAWFLSLVSPGPHREDKAHIDVPFWVAGLQQLWREDGLALHVLAVSHEESQQQCPKPKKKGMHKGRSLFHHRVCRFLSQTSLSAATHWLPPLRTLLDQQAYPPTIYVPSSCLDCFVSVNSDKTAVERAFDLSPGFYWQTLETPEPRCQRAETMCAQQLHTEVTIALGNKALFLQPLVTHHTLQLIHNSGLDVCGLRLLYPPYGLLTNSAGNVLYGQRCDGAIQPILALAIRGPHARKVWQDVSGPSDPLLARKTDPASINALHCSSKDQPLLYSPRLASRVHRELCFWFAGRAPGDNSHNPNQALNDRAACDDGEGNTPWCLTRPATLCAAGKADVFVVVSPAVAPCCYSQVLSVCERRGFSLKGLQRLQLRNKRAQSLGLTSQQVSVFCSPPTVKLGEEQVELSSHCLVLLLRRESALHHSASLPTALMKELEEQKLIGCISSRLSNEGKVDPSCCFHILPYNESLLHSFGRRMWAVPDPCGVVLSNRRCPSNPEMEQVVVLTLSDRNMGQGLSLLHRLLRGYPADDVEEDGFELLALKWLPTLSWQHAREVSPFEVGDRQWQSSLVGLTSSAALVCVLRRMDAFATLRRLLPCDYPGDLSVLMSPSPELAFRQASLFFSEGEMIPDHSVRPLLKFLPPSCINIPGSQSESLFNYMVQGPQLLVTLCLFKPGVWSHTLGKILSKVQQNGFTLVGLHVVVLDTNAAMSLVSTGEHQEPSDVEAQVQYLCSGPSLALCLQRENAVRRLLDLLGPEEQEQVQARAQDQFLWRACYGADCLHSGIYGSGSYQRAVEDVKRVFAEGLCCTETDIMRQEQIACVSSDPLACLTRQQSHIIATISKDKPSISLFMALGLNGGPLVRSALCQTTCLLMPSNVLRLSQTSLHQDLLERLLRTGCHLVAGRMSVLNKAQSRHITETLAQPSKKERTIPHLPSGPCLILALQRDNVVTCFDFMLESIYRERSDLEKVGKMIVYPRTEKEAMHLLCYLFDVLSPDSHHAIVPQ